MNRFGSTRTRAAWAAVLLVAAAGCAGSSSNGSGPTTNTPASTAALATALASSSDSAGTLLCGPTSAQVDACSGLALADPCTLVSTAFGKVTGACRVTLDGTTVACAPKPPEPPEWLAAPCASKKAGDACQPQDPFGDTHDGLCVPVPGGTTLVCGRGLRPPAGAIAACDGAAAGDACALPDPVGAASAAVGRTGVCTLGPVGTGPLACAPSQQLFPPGLNACKDLAAGAACSIGPKPFALSGTCVTPVAGGEPICVVACGAVAGPFHPGGKDGEVFDPWPVCTGHPGFDPSDLPTTFFPHPWPDPRHIGSFDPGSLPTAWPTWPPDHGKFDPWPIPTDWPHWPDPGFIGSLDPHPPCPHDPKGPPSIDPWPVPTMHPMPDPWPVPTVHPMPDPWPVPTAFPMPDPWPVPTAFPNGGNRTPPGPKV